MAVCSNKDSSYGPAGCWNQQRFNTTDESWFLALWHLESRPKYENHPQVATQLHVLSLRSKTTFFVLIQLLSDIHILYLLHNLYLCQVLHCLYSLLILYQNILYSLLQNSIVFEKYLIPHLHILYPLNNIHSKPSKHSIQSLKMLYSLPIIYTQSKLYTFYSMYIFYILYTFYIF